MNLRTFVLITAILELGAGVVFFLVPHLLPQAEPDNALAIMWNRMFGVAAIALAYYAMLVWKNFGVGPATGFTKVFIVFHVGTAAALYYGYSAGYDIFLGGVAFHAIMAMITLFYSIKMRSSDVKT